MKTKKIIMSIGLSQFLVLPLVAISCSDSTHLTNTQWNILLNNWQVSEGFKNKSNEEVKIQYLGYYLIDFQNFNNYFKQNLENEYQTHFKDWVARNKSSDGKLKLTGNYKQNHKIPEYKGMAKLFYVWSKTRMHWFTKSEYKPLNQINEIQKKKIRDPIFKSLYIMYNRLEKQSSPSTGGFSTIQEFYWNNRSKFWSDLKNWAILYNLNAYENRKPFFPAGQAVQKMKNTYKGSQDLLKIIKYTLQSAFEEKFYYHGQQQYVNWWHYEIGFPKYLLNLILPIRKDISNVEANKYMSGYTYFKSDPLFGRTAPTAINNYKPSKKLLSTGANLADHALNAIKASILNRDANKLNYSTKIIYDQILKKFTQTGDGFYRDGGFIQHSNIPYVGTYGRELLKAIAKIAYILDGTNVDLFKTNPKFRNVFLVIQKSVMPFIYRGVLSSTVGGRGITRAGSEFLGVELLRYVSMLEKYADAEYKVKIQNFLAQNINQLNNDIEKLPEDDILSMGWQVHKKNKYIAKWIGKKYEDIIDYSSVKISEGIHQIQSIDRVVAKRKKWAMSVAFHSSRIGNFEGMGRENLQGMYHGDGMRLIQTEKNSNPYTSQYWWGVNPYKLPGTTADISTKFETDKPPSSSKDSWSHWIDHNAGKSLLGISGGTSLDNIATSFGVYTNFTEKVKTKKSLFILDDEILALGKTNSWDPKGKIYTTLENRIGGHFRKNWNSKKFIYTSDQGSKIGYRILSNNIVKMDKEDAREAWLTNRRYGKWVGGKYVNNSKKAKKTSKKFNSIRLNHMDKDSTKFAYVITPGAENFKTLDNLQTRIKIIENNAWRQAVEYTNSKGEEYLIVNYLSKSSGVGNYKFLFSPSLKEKLLKNAKTTAEKNEIEKKASVEIKSSSPVSLIFKRYKINGEYRYKMSVRSAEIGTPKLKLKFNKEIKAFNGPFKTIYTESSNKNSNLEIEQATINLRIETQWAEKTRIKLDQDTYFTDSQSLTLHFDERYKFNNPIMIEFTLGE